MYGWVPSLFTWNYHNIVNRLDPNTKLKVKKKETHDRQGKLLYVLKNRRGCLFRTFEAPGTQSWVLTRCNYRIAWVSPSLTSAGCRQYLERLMTQTSLAPATPTPCPQPLKRPALCLSMPHRVLIHAHRPVQFVWDCPAQIPKSHVVPWSRREESSSLLSARSLPSRLQLLEGSGSNPACSFPLAGTHTCVHRAGLGWAQIQVLVMWQTHCCCSISSQILHLVIASDHPLSSLGTTDWLSPF